VRVYTPRDPWTPIYMWLVYLVALILGGGVLLVQVVSGAGHGADLAHDMGVDHVEGPGLLSTRSVMYALFTFGFVGFLLHVPGLLSPNAALAVAAAAAVVTGALVGYVFQVMGDPKASGAAHLHEAKGLRGRMLVGSAPGQRGKVRLTLAGQTVDLLATSTDAIAEGTEVTVLEVQGGQARVGR
jgi:membrane protein implicated in regulation of membrane protease activity